MMTDLQGMDGALATMGCEMLIFPK